MGCERAAFGVHPRTNQGQPRNYRGHRGPLKGCFQAISAHLYMCEQNAEAILWYVVRQQLSAGWTCRNRSSFAFGKSTL